MYIVCVSLIERMKRIRFGEVNTNYSPTNNVYMVNSVCNFKKENMNKKYEIVYYNFCDLLNGDFDNIILNNKNIDNLNIIEKTDYDESDHRQILNFYVGDIVDIDKVKYDVNVKYF